MRINTLIVALCAMLGLGGAFEKANAQVVLSVGIAPPALPVYVQPEIPGPDYIWTPGYWSWNGDISEYYWVPGAWVLAPRPGLLWTPGYWGWSGGEYVWNAGYWGPTVGFYGGVSYGFGYTGEGFAGGYWSGGSFYYNVQLQISVTLQSSTMSTTSRLSITTQPTLAITEEMAAYRPILPSEIFRPRTSSISRPPMNNNNINSLQARTRICARR